MKPKLLLPFLFKREFIVHKSPSEYRRGCLAQTGDWVGSRRRSPCGGRSLVILDPFARQGGRGYGRRCGP